VVLFKGVQILNTTHFCSETLKKILLEKTDNQINRINLLKRYYKCSFNCLSPVCQAIHYHYLRHQKSKFLVVLHLHLLFLLQCYE